MNFLRFFALLQTFNAFIFAEICLIIYVKIEVNLQEINRSQLPYLRKEMMRNMVRNIQRSLGCAEKESLNVLSKKVLSKTE